MYVLRNLGGNNIEQLGVAVPAASFQLPESGFSTNSLLQDRPQYAPWLHNTIMATLVNLTFSRPGAVWDHRFWGNQAHYTNPHWRSSLARRAYLCGQQQWTQNRKKKRVQNAAGVETSLTIVIFVSNGPRAQSTRQKNNLNTLRDRSSGTIVRIRSRTSTNRCVC